MRRLALAAVLAAAVATPASAGTVSDACWSLVPTFRGSGLVCPHVPTDVAAWCFDTVPGFRTSALVCTKIPAGT
ncbi:MAG TPA: hypothetical protein VGX28_01020 [Frankiaceae bacterium]|jgi:ABC-type transport system involved in cytochrome c biogenesis permease subunit|nr:hypothetical protein [Frankiaceae bacterium]